MSNGVPVVSMQDLSPEDFAKQFGDSFARYGFAVISDHGIDPALVERAWALSEVFFKMPDAEKRRFHRPELAGARGFTPFGTEIAKGAKHVDLKEFWHIGRDLPAGHPLLAQQPNNMWPESPEGFREAFTEIFAELDRVGGQLLSALGVYLGLGKEWFAPTVADGNSVLRLLHYPPVEGRPDGIRAEAHEDINTITLLLGAEEAGLEILDRDGQWLPVAPPPGAISVNVGDMLQRLTNNRLPSTTHRVVNPDTDRAAHSRYSMPFFLHFRSDFLIETLPDCIDATHPNLYPEPITADDYLQQRLREIGLKK